MSHKKQDLCEINAIVGTALYILYTVSQKKEKKQAKLFLL